MLSVLQSGVEIHVYRGELDEARRIASLFAGIADSTDLQDQSCWRASTAALRARRGAARGGACSRRRPTIETAATLGPNFQSVKQGVVDALEAALGLGDTAKVEELLAFVEGQLALRPVAVPGGTGVRFRARLSGDRGGAGRSGGTVPCARGSVLAGGGPARAGRGCSGERRAPAAACRGAGDLRAARRGSLARAAPAAWSGPRWRYDLRAAAGPRTRPAGSSAPTAARRSPPPVRRAAPRTAAAKFCGECGAALGRASAPAAPATARRRPSAGSSPCCSPTSSASPPASESRDAEDTRELLSRYFDTCRTADRALRRHGREVHRRRGDGGLGDAGRERGRRRARGARRARPRRRRARSSTPRSRPVRAC